jgi:hypothetical protein
MAQDIAGVEIAVEQAVSRLHAIDARRRQCVGELRQRRGWEVVQLGVEVRQRGYRPSLGQQRRAGKSVEHHAGPAVHLDHLMHAGTGRLCGPNDTGAFELDGGERLELRHE